MVKKESSQVGEGKDGMERWNGSWLNLRSRSLPAWRGKHAKWATRGWQGGARLRNCGVQQLPRSNCTARRTSSLMRLQQNLCRSLLVLASTFSKAPDAFVRSLAKREPLPRTIIALESYNDLSITLS